EIILKSDNSSFLHSPIWAKIMEKTYNYRTATRLYELEGKEILIPMMELNLSKYGLKTFASMPGTNDQGGIFSKSEITRDDFKAIVNDIVGGKNLSLYMNLSLYGLSSNIKEEWRVKDEFNYVQFLNLEEKTFEDIWNKYKGYTRRAIRKAKKSGVEVRDATSLDEFKTFYDIYAQASKKWGFETPLFPFKLLENLYKYGSDHIKVSLAIKDDKIIAGNLFFTYSKTMYGYMGAFLREYGTFQPTSLLYNEVIEYAFREGYKYVNFGPSGNLKHIRRFKDGFGAEKADVDRCVIHSTLAKIMNKINELKS
ncbi:MAG: GNAT family N-acetyltransferase, partial [Methanobacterium sp.]